MDDIIPESFELDYLMLYKTTYNDKFKVILQRILKLNYSNIENVKEDMLILRDIFKDLYNLLNESDKQRKVIK